MMIIKPSYDRRCQTYTNALIEYGESKQVIVAIEEFSEAAKELCKVLRGKGNLDHLAEEIADARICIEQIELFFPIRDKVDDYMEMKIRRLDRRLHEGDDDRSDSGLLEMND